MKKKVIILAGIAIIGVIFHYYDEIEILNK